ncbi:putative endonuclease/exonuclease/phosphatase [Campylobacter mucosalis]|uniref:endonuclease/exonuclease/phosphatase family protein n=1 Tax=Campylobacter mucosalis TaxID=202 RepID=UPI00068F3DA5|nr:endonuclease/exonuclease/phosphatase family protein [Campylobacter mucosalis]QKF62880.1 putative endonuclease/exonuclease/phosphatase [Campylobacter mucosalis]
MKKFLIFILLSVCAFSQTLKIATYNVENLFDGKNNGNEYPDFRIGKSKWSDDKFKDKLKNIKQVINSVNADIIALQEIENEIVLKELVKDTQYKFLSFCSPKNSPVGLGIISKIKPSLEHECISVKGVKTRDILKQKFSLDGKEFVIFVNHFPAFKNGLDKQESAVKTLLKAIREESLSVIALGDFNTPFGKKNILAPIEINESFKNLWRELNASERYSFAGYGKKRAIDHVLLSPSFFKDELFYACGSFGVFKSGLVDDKGYAKKENNENLYSDHLPLVFEISTDRDKKCGFWSKF